MYKLSTMRRFILPIVLLAVTSILAQSEPRWPVTGEVDLSSGFGDFRAGGRFHKGVDIRTAGQVGRPVESPVDGYIWRVWMSYYGAGKAIYIKGDDGLIYICYHLSVLIKDIDELVVNEQQKQRRYSIDMYLPEDSVRVTRGQLIAYSGKTGTGAPHLHFEVRTSDNRPIDPLSHGYQITDQAPPVFTRLGFELTDDHSLLPNGQRRLFLDCAGSGYDGQYELDTVLYLNAPFGFLLDGYDLLRPGGMQQSIARLSVFIDDSLFYRSTLDTLDFDSDEYSVLEYDIFEIAEERNRVRRLYKPAGDAFRNSFAPANQTGIYGDRGFQRPGRHRALIVGEDALGNRSTLGFEFIWGKPDAPFFALDSMLEIHFDTAEFFFSPTQELDPINIDSIVIVQNQGYNWMRRPDAGGVLSRKEDGRLHYVHQGSWRPAFMKLAVYHDGLSMFTDEPFNGISDHAGKPASMKYVILDGGILIELDAKAKFAPKARIELFYRDSLLGTVHPEPFTMRQHRAFISASPQYRRIDRIGWVLSLRPEAPLEYQDVNIHLIGHNDVAVPVDEFLTLRIDSADFFSPQFIEVSSNSVADASLLHLNSRHYSIVPEVLTSRRKFDLELRLPTKNDYNKNSGICWLDKKKDDWIWLENTFSNDSLKAETVGGGSFAAVFDYDPPIVWNLRPSDGSAILERRPNISFGIVDSLSGVYDDRDITIELDGAWMIPEYDPESGTCVARVRKDLEPGKHHLGVIVRDRAGNITEQYVNFTVRKGK